MINELLESQTLPTKDSVNCINCQHCYIPQDFLLGLSPPELYCNVDKNRPPSGDVLSEPFDYYKAETFEWQYNEWAQWADTHKVGLTTYCDKFERAI